MKGNNKEEKGLENEARLKKLKKQREKLNKEIYQLTVNVGHGFDLIDEDGATRQSNAAAIRILGEALEILEKKVLWEMGGQIGGIKEMAELHIHTSGRFIAGYVWLDFDADVLRDYLDKAKR